MYGRVFGCCVQGIHGYLVEVEADVSNGLPQIHLVGLPDSAVRESIDRIRAAIKNTGYRFPQQRLTINLAPADLRKEGSAFDLAIAAGILLATGEINCDVKGTLFIGELSLEGKLRPVPGVLPMTNAAKQAGFERVVLPLDNAAEAALISGITIVPIASLADLHQLDQHEHATGCMQIVEDTPSPEAPGSSGSSGSSGQPINAVNYMVDQSGNSDHDDHLLGDYADVRGQHRAKRAAMIAAAGRHHMLLIGPPGSGKTMIARRLPTIMPKLSEEEALEVMQIYSVVGKLPSSRRLMAHRPFRSPHHTISSAGLIGGGGNPKPGEISLAHHGVLFLDELPEFPRSVLESLRQPIEDGIVTIGRARSAMTFPTSCMLVCAMNPCPCGFAGVRHPVKECTCRTYRKEQYLARISGPLLDRIDLHVDVPYLDYTRLHQDQFNLSSAQMREQIMVAEARQSMRYRDEQIRTNRELQGRLLRKYCTTTSEANDMLRNYYDDLGLSIRAHDRILKIARTIADLEDCEQIELSHLAEALEYRMMDMPVVNEV